MDLPIEVTLTRPILDGDDRVTVLTFDEPELGDQIDFADMLAAMPDAPTQADAARCNLFWIARSAGISEALARKIKSGDLEQVNAVVDKILPESLEGDGDASGDASGDVLGNGSGPNG